MKIVHKSGKRKSSIARATIKEGKGQIRINSKLLENYTPSLARDKIKEPLHLAGDIIKKIRIDVNVNGGGFRSQSDAIRLAIARALVEYTQDKKLEKAFLDYDRQLLVADTRSKEQRKPNASKARAKRQKSYR
ncbi:MAG: 30S ribosomal protein S9 [Nanoarchaeota archaeon]|nr:30S ribosomal protein S9 [Nanoarchaeota archaeon]